MIPLLQETLEAWIPGGGALQFITLRALLAAATAFLVCIVAGPPVIRWLAIQKLGEKIRTDSSTLNEILAKAGKPGTPTMGGVLIVGAILFSTVLFARLDNLPVILCLWTTAAMGALGGVDDWRKMTVKGSKGLSERAKLSWQTAIAMAVTAALFMHSRPEDQPGLLGMPPAASAAINLGALSILFGSLVVVGSSNAVNFTDGLDGLAAGCTALTAAALAPIAYAAGRADWSGYLHMAHVPSAGEVTIFLAAMGGASLGFLWWNCNPARVFMGDTGSLALGGGLAVAALAARQEWALAVAGGVFVWEALSVIIQRFWFKRTRRRVFLCAPFHHHLQMRGWTENQIVTRLWMVGALFVMATLAMVKVR
jgi:phospho-N-acetylmuramoyl-pentapeptide-transferase